MFSLIQVHNYRPLCTIKDGLNEILIFARKSLLEITLRHGDFRVFGGKCAKIKLNTHSRNSPRKYTKRKKSNYYPAVGTGSSSTLSFFFRVHLLFLLHFYHGHLPHTAPVFARPNKYSWQIPTIRLGVNLYINKCNLQV